MQCKFKATSYTIPQKGSVYYSLRLPTNTHTNTAFLEHRHNDKETKPHSDLRTHFRLPDNKPSLLSDFVLQCFPVNASSFVLPAQNHQSKKNQTM
ncbi:hypothetical protein H0G86_013324 [Trichoderma simmonsii]|uniref:Uncharacterized protein n=1 Tax=Trichoderma simmonsii TaxID=1491479 RepID=A0A8G0PGP5_9HYPO|nr:hypothetical protein H0G86_013324 [Trichoderma simmonsii]